MVRFSYCHVPAYPLEESIKIIATADECGFYAAYSVDETWWKDMWLLFAAAADKTSRIRMGPNVTHVILRDPAHVAQMAATLDQLTNGRAEIVVSFGNISMLPQHGIDTEGMKPLSRVMEAREVMRTLLDTGAVTYEGEFFKHTGLWTLARPVQDKLPIKLGAMGGPRSFEVGGELFDGVHQAIGTSRETYQYMVDHVRAGAEKAGRNWQDLDIGAWLVMAVMEDSAGRQGDGAHHGRLLPVGDARAAAQPPRHQRRGPEADLRRVRRRRRPEGARADHARARREVLGCRHAGGGGRASPARHHLDRGQPHHRCASSTRTW